MSLAEFSLPRKERYFEDYRPGDVYEFAETIQVSEEDLIRFSEQFDPQYFHTDPVAARSSIYKGLIGSGGHTIALSFRLYIRNYLPDRASCGGSGMDEVRWLKPLRPGDTVRIRVCVKDARPSQSQAHLGVLRTFVETINQHDEVIMTYEAINFLARRPG